MPDDGYYFKIATDYHSMGKISMDMSIEKIVRTIARAKRIPLTNFTVIMLERDRHNEILAKLRKLGVRILTYPGRRHRRRSGCCLPNSGVDMLIGAGAGPEATIAATAVKILGGTMLAKVWQDKKDDSERMERLKKAGVDIDKTYNQDELAKGKELVFAASGVTKGELLDGVRIVPNGAIVYSICMRFQAER